MSTDPWTADDPQPSDCDAVLAHVDRQYVARHEGDQLTRVRILVSDEGDDVQRLERIAQDLGKTPHDVVAELLRDADRPGARR